MPEVWPFVPLPEISENLTWKTAITKTAFGEIRDSLMDAVQSVTYAHSCSRYLPLAEELYRLVRGGLWDVPIWADSSKAGRVLATDTVLNVDLNADYGDRAFVFGGDGSFQVVEIDSIGAGLNLSAPIGVAYANPSVMPIKQGYLLGGISKQKPSRDFLSFEATFRLTDGSQAAEAAALQYLGLDYFVCACCVIEPLDGSLSLDVEILDNGVGSIEVEPLREVFENRFGASIAKRTAASRWAFRKWLFHIRGRDRAFWVPDWAGALSLQNAPAAGSTTITVSPIFNDTASYIGRHVFFGDDFREITGAFVDGVDHVLTVAALNEAASKAVLLRKVRLDQDSVDLRHVRHFVSRASLVFYEVPA